MSSETLYCSFCAKSQHDVTKIIAGPTALICDECTELCWDIVLEDRRRTPVIRHREMIATDIGCVSRLSIITSGVPPTGRNGSAIHPTGRAPEPLTTTRDERGEEAINQFTYPDSLFHGGTTTHTEDHDHA